MLRPKNPKPTAHVPLTMFLVNRNMLITTHFWKPLKMVSIGFLMLELFKVFLCLFVFLGYHVVLKKVISASKEESSFDEVILTATVKQIHFLPQKKYLNLYVSIKSSFYSSKTR